ncbi:MAG TPA: hypothetical protein VN495_04195 [Candidatus Paceibacterota bacterium]|nr:hypothetical protein [Candidatus Paceibacterota bacterium]
MAYKQSESLLVVRKLPDVIEVTLCSGMHRGKTQLYANWSDGTGNHYKLVVCDASVAALSPSAGERWTMRPDYTPNGHIVICSISRPVEKVRRSIALEEGMVLGDLAMRMKEAPAQLIQRMRQVGHSFYFDTVLSLSDQRFLVEQFGHTVADDFPTLAEMQEVIGGIFGLAKCIPGAAEVLALSNRQIGIFVRNTPGGKKGEELWREFTRRRDSWQGSEPYSFTDFVREVLAGAGHPYTGHST